MMVKNELRFCNFESMYCRLAVWRVVFVPAKLLLILWKWPAAALRYAIEP